MQSPVRYQLMLEDLVVPAVDDGVEDHGADRELLHPAQDKQGAE